MIQGQREGVRILQIFLNVSVLHEPSLSTLPLYVPQEGTLGAQLLCYALRSSTLDISQWNFLVLFCVAAPSK